MRPRGGGAPGAPAPSPLPKDVAERPQAYFRPASTNDLEWLKAARRLVRHRAKVDLELSEAEPRLKIGRLRFRG